MSQTSTELSCLGSVSRILFFFHYFRIWLTLLGGTQRGTRCLQSLHQSVHVAHCRQRASCRIEARDADTSPAFFCHDVYCSVKMVKCHDNQALVVYYEIFGLNFSNDGRV